MTRYLGLWYEIARLPQWFEKNLHQVSATYSPDGGELRIVNRGVQTFSAPRSAVTSAGMLRLKSGFSSSAWMSSVAFGNVFASLQAGSSVVNCSSKFAKGHCEDFILFS